jgi:hypothetical protein
MSSKQYFGIIMLGLLILGGAFYWYEYKPSKIKQQCSAEARFDQRAILEPNDSKRQEVINMYYEDCLMRFGIGK